MFEFLGCAPETFCLEDHLRFIPKVDSVYTPQASAGVPMIVKSIKGRKMLKVYSQVDGKKIHVDKCKVQIINPIYDDELSEEVKTHLVALLGDPDEDWLTKASILKLFLRHGISVDQQPSLVPTLRKARRNVKMDKNVKRFICEN